MLGLRNNKKKYKYFLIVFFCTVLQLSFINCGPSFESNGFKSEVDLSSEQQSSDEFINTEMEIDANNEPDIDQSPAANTEQSSPILPKENKTFTIAKARKITNNTASFAMRHFYSTRSSFNADSTLIVLQEGKEGTTLARDQVLVDINGNRVGDIPVNLDVIWSRLNPDVLFGIIEVNESKYEFVKYNIKSKEKTVYYTSKKYFELGYRKGALSYDERYIAINTNDNGKEYRVYDLVENRLIAKTKDIHRTSSTSLVLYMAPSGNYVIAIELDKVNGGVSYFRYDRDLKNRTLLTKNANHSGININSKGEDILVVNGNLEIVNVKSKKIIKGFNDNKAIYGHVSGSGLPGQFILSGKINGDRQIVEINSDHGQDAFKKRIFWGDLKDQNAISYRALAKPNVSPDGRFVIFTEDYKDSTHRHDEFILEKIFDEE